MRVPVKPRAGVGSQWRENRRCRLRDHPDQRYGKKGCCRLYADSVDIRAEFKR